MLLLKRRQDKHAERAVLREHLAITRLPSCSLQLKHQCLVSNRLDLVRIEGLPAKFAGDLLGLDVELEDLGALALGLLLVRLHLVLHFQL